MKLSNLKDSGGKTHIKGSNFVAALPRIMQQAIRDETGWDNWPFAIALHRICTYIIIIIIIIVICYGAAQP